MHIIALILVAAAAAPLPWTFRNACRLYLEALNPVSAARELYARGELDAWVHPVRAIRRSDRAFVERVKTDLNVESLAFEAELAARATNALTVPVHARDELNRAMAIHENLEYHVVINSRRAFYVRDDGLVVFPRGWALFIDPTTKLVESTLGPHGERELPRD